MGGKKGKEGTYQNLTCAGRALGATNSGHLKALESHMFRIRHLVHHFSAEYRSLPIIRVGSRGLSRLISFWDCFCLVKL